MVPRIAIVFVVLACAQLAQPAKILGVFPTPSISHQVVFRALMKALAGRGHEIVMMTPNPFDKQDNLTQIDVHDLSYAVWRKVFNFVDIKETKMSGLDLYRVFYSTANIVGELQLDTPEMQKILKDPEIKFDLCFFEALVPLMFPFKDRFNCSMILISSLSAAVQQFDTFGNPSHPILYPDIMTPYLGVLDFWQRLEMALADLTYRYFYYNEILPMFDASAKKKFGENTRSVYDVERDADMLFLNTHPLLGDIRPTVPSIIYMGNMHMHPRNPLPHDLKKFLDGSNNGVIYLSLGSNVKSNQLSQNKVNAFLEAFKVLPYSVVWKWENETLPGKPNNVFISKWLPQQDVLAHPNVKLFITQGGQQSMEEAIHYKVPLIGIPFFGDQDLNVRKFMKFEIGTSLNLHFLTKENIIDAVNTILSNSSYQKNIEKLSDLLVDQPQSSMERAIWWTEYVLRHKGAQHLKSPATRVPLYQYFMLDIMLFVLFSLFGFLSTVSVVVICLWKLIKRRKENKLKTS